MSNAEVLHREELPDFPRGFCATVSFEELPDGENPVERVRAFLASSYGRTLLTEHGVIAVRRRKDPRFDFLQRAEKASMDQENLMRHYGAREFDSNGNCPLHIHDTTLCIAPRSLEVGTVFDTSTRETDELLGGTLTKEWVERFVSESITSGSFLELDGETRWVGPGEKRALFHQQLELFNRQQISVHTFLSGLHALCDMSSESIRLQREIQRLVQRSLREVTLDERFCMLVIEAERRHAYNLLSGTERKHSLFGIYPFHPLPSEEAGSEG